jgi:hypothetical protein
MPAILLIFFHSTGGVPVRPNDASRNERVHIATTNPRDMYAVDSAVLCTNTLRSIRISLVRQQVSHASQYARRGRSFNDNSSPTECERNTGPRPGSSCGVPLCPAHISRTRSGYPCIVIRNITDASTVAISRPCSTSWS